MGGLWEPLTWGTLSAPEVGKHLAGLSVAETSRAVATGRVREVGGNAVQWDGRIQVTFVVENEAV